MQPISLLLTSSEIATDGHATSGQKNSNSSKDKDHIALWIWVQGFPLNGVE